MAAFRSITPEQAIHLAEAAGVSDPHRIIMDFAAAGVVKAYSLVSETLLATGKGKVVRGGSIAADVWKRIQSEGQSDAIWVGGTTRLAADTPKGLPEVHITGVTFSEASLQRLIEHQGGNAPPLTMPVDTTKPEQPAGETASVHRSPSPAAIPSGAVTVTVKQTMAALGLGRTKVNELMNDGRLVRKKIDGRTLIEVDSIRRLVSEHRLQTLS